MTTILPLPLILIFLLLLAVLSFFFSATETAIIGLSKIRLRHMVARGIKRAQSIQRLIAKLDKFIVAILVGNNFVNIAISVMVAAICVLFFGYKWGMIIATLATAFFILIICEITPKILAIKHTERMALAVAPLMEMLIKLFGPIITIFSQISNLIIKLLRISQSKRSPLITEEELRLMIELGQEEGFLSAEEGRMLQCIFEFGKTKLSDVMIPKEQIVAVDINTTSDELLNTFVEKGHARLAVYQGSIDNIIGIIYSHDLLYILRDKGLFLLPDLIHEVYYAPANMLVNELLKKFQSDKIQIAIVVDAKRKTEGLVTLEDLIEEIVGELEEKHLKITSRIKK